MNKKRQLLHEKFHRTTSAQDKIIPLDNFTYRHILRVLNAYIRKPGRILDIGCGSGTLSFFLAQKGYSVVGIDISKKAIADCVKSALKLDLTKHTEFKTVDFPSETVNGKFTYVLMIEVLEHLSNDELALSKIYNSLEKGGIAIITTPSVSAPLHKLGYTRGFDERVGHLRRYELQKLCSMCRNIGFVVVESYGEEGILRNFLFLSPLAGKTVRFIKFFLSDIVSGLDWITCKLFGPSDLILVLQK